jgi:UDP-glucuronate decarboxylase
LIEGFIRLMRHPSFQGPVNLGNPVEFTMNELAEQVLQLTNSSSAIVHLPLPKDDPKQRRPSISVAKRELNWEPLVPLLEGLKHTIAYFDQLLSES